MKTLVFTILGALTVVAVIWIAAGCGTSTSTSGRGGSDTVWVGQPVINDFSATRGCQQYAWKNRWWTLTWNVGNADNMTITANPADPNAPNIVCYGRAESATNITEPQGSIIVKPHNNTAYTLTLTNPCGTVSKTVALSAVQYIGDPVASLEADSQCVQVGGSTNVTWEICDCHIWASSFSSIVPNVPCPWPVKLNETTKFYIHCAGWYGHGAAVAAYTTVWVGPPKINKFECATPTCDCLGPGDELSLDLDVANADNVTITSDNDPNLDVEGKLESLHKITWTGPYKSNWSGKLDFIPGGTGSITYLLTAENPCGEDEQMVEVQVQVVPLPSIVGGGPISPLFIGAHDTSATLDVKLNDTAVWLLRDGLTGAVVGEGKFDASPGEVKVELSPAKTNEYVLELTNKCGDRCKEKVLVYKEEPPPYIVLEASDYCVTPGSGHPCTLLKWNVIGAAQLKLSADPPDSKWASPLEWNCTGTSADNGWKTICPAADTTYTLEATNEQGTKRQETITVQVAPWPVISQFDVKPTAQGCKLSWEVYNPSPASSPTADPSKPVCIEATCYDVSGHPFGIYDLGCFPPVDETTFSPPSGTPAAWECEYTIRTVNCAGAEAAERKSCRGGVSPAPLKSPKALLEIDPACFYRSWQAAPTVSDARLTGTVSNATEWAIVAWGEGYSQTIATATGLDPNTEYPVSYPFLFYGNFDNFTLTATGPEGTDNATVAWAFCPQRLEIQTFTGQPAPASSSACEPGATWDLKWIVADNSCAISNWKPSAHIDIRRDDAPRSPAFLVGDFSGLTGSTSYTLPKGFDCNKNYYFRLAISDCAGNTIEAKVPITPAVSPPPVTGAACSENCDCLTEKEALDLGYTTLCQQEPCSAPGEPQKFCYSRCPEGCYCVTEKEADEQGYTISCSDEICDSSGKEPKYCFSPPLQPCSQRCQCLTQAQAKEYGYSDAQRCQTTPCKQDTQGKDMYCYPKPKAPVVDVTADRSFVTLGGDVRVCWDVAGEGITEVLFTAAGGKPTRVDPQGCKTFRPTQQTRYLVTAKSPAGSGQDAVIVGVGQPPPVEEVCPTITAFTANCPTAPSPVGPAAVAPREQWTAQPCTTCCSVSWSVIGPAGTTVSISGIGNVGMSGSTQAQGGASYVLTARYGNCVRTATVQVPK